MDIIITIIPRAIATIANFIIGEDNVLLCYLPAIMRLAINNS